MPGDLQPNVTLKSLYRTYRCSSQPDIPKTSWFGLAAAARRESRPCPAPRCRPCSGDSFPCCASCGMQDNPSDSGGAHTCGGTSGCRRRRRRRSASAGAASARRWCRGPSTRRCGSRRRPSGRWCRPSSASRRSRAPALDGDDAAPHPHADLDARPSPRSGWCRRSSPTGCRGRPRRSGRRRCRGCGSARPSSRRRPSPRRCPSPRSCRPSCRRRGACRRCRRW